MRRTIAIAAATAALGTGALAATTAVGAPADSTGTASVAHGARVDARRARVPNEVGKNHQAAQDDLQAHGFFNLRERDCTGRGRLLLFDRNWRVVRQTPRAGSRVTTDRAITLCSVKYSD